MRALYTTVTIAAMALFGALLPVSPAAAATVTVSDAGELIDAFDTATGTDTEIVLSAPLTVTPDDGHVAVPDGVSVTLDLAGYALDITAGESLAGIGVAPGAGLTVEDSAGDGLLVSTGGADAAGIGGGRGEAAGTIAIDSGTVIATGSPEDLGLGSGAGIGGGSNGGSGEITIAGGEVVALGAHLGAGIGGGGSSAGDNGGVIMITGGEVRSDGGSWGGAGVGASAGRSAGPVLITGGTVIATGGGGGGVGAGPGIGQGGSGAMPVTISGGTVTAIGGSSEEGGGAGIGGGDTAPGTLTEITGGTVTAIGAAGGAGIGGGGHAVFSEGAGGEVRIGAGAIVDVASDGGNTIGNGAGATDFGSLVNAGDLTIGAGTLTIPAGATAENSGTLTAAGDVVNEGAIVNTGTVVNPENVSVHHYLLEYDLNGAPGDVPAHRVFAATLDDAQLTPPAPERAAHEFTGWFPVADATDGALTGATVLSEAGDGPLTSTWYAGWQWVVPGWEGPATAELTEGEEVSVSLSVTDATGLTLTSGDLPDGLTATLSADAVTFSGTPDAGAAGEYELEVTATNDGGSVDLPLTVTVVAPETSPEPTPTAEPTTEPTADPTPSAPPTVETESDPELADTGANVQWAIGIALVLVVGGLVALLVRRRAGR